MENTIFTKKGKLTMTSGNISEKSGADTRKQRGFKLTKRDEQMLLTIYFYRAVTAPMIEDLFFPSSQENGRDYTQTNCQYRLRLLYKNGYLLRTEQEQRLSEGRKPYVYFLNKKGTAVVAERLGCAVIDLDWSERDNTFSSLFLNHLLTCNTVRVAVTVAAQQQGFSLTEWKDERALKRDHKRDTVTLSGSGDGKSTVIPDGYFILEKGTGLYRFFLEVDLATETVVSSIEWRRTWARKMKQYAAYFESEAYKARYGTAGGRVITVTTSEQRLANLKAATEAAGGRLRYWFSTLGNATAKNILTQPIWAVASRDSLWTLTWEGELTN
jgi:hypothetical protein